MCFGGQGRGRGQKETEEFFQYIGIFYLFEMESLKFIS
jgi:hypothetical protein